MHAIKLKHGMLYDCTMDGNLGNEKTRIVPLATDDQGSKRFIIIDAKQLQRENPDLIRRLIAMSFNEIVQEDLDGGPDRQWSSFVWKCKIDEHGALYYEAHNCYLEDLVESDTIK